MFITSNMKSVFNCFLIVSLVNDYTCHTITKHETENGVRVNKCCERGEVFMGNHCQRIIESSDEREWQPFFTDEEGIPNVQVVPRIATGLPDCGSHQQWPIFHHKNSQDKLQLLPNGKLRHYIHRALSEEEQITDNMFYDYEQGQYCIDKRIDNATEVEYAILCGIEFKTDWTTEFLMRNIINPITHLIAIMCLLAVAIIYFVMPTLKDLVGNIVTTISVCLIISECANLIRLLTIFKSNVSLIITEAVCYISLLGAFFWLNSLAYYIWKTFKSRNVYLRITDSKKYCYYSSYAWSCTAIMGFLAVFAHYTMDYETDKRATILEEQEQIGSLGMIIFFMPVAFTVLVNVFFIATTFKILNRMNTYGRIHHKLKHSFRMFILLFLIMSLAWVFFLMSFSKFDGLVYAHIIVNACQAPLIMYVCLVNQSHVSYLVRKTCCYANCICPCCRPDSEPEWGDEMTAMNNGFA